MADPARRAATAGKVTRRTAPRARVVFAQRRRRRAAFLGNHRIHVMTPVQPLSVKFPPEVRERIKRIAFLLDWPEGQFVNASVAVVLEMIDKPSLRLPHKTVHLARQALDFAERNGIAVETAKSERTD